MEFITVFFFLIGLGVVVIQIMMIVKFFEIAADIRVLKDTITKYLPHRDLDPRSPLTDSSIRPISYDEPIENEDKDTEPNSDLLDKDGLYKGVSGWPFAIVIIVAVVIAFVLLAVYISQK